MDSSQQLPFIVLQQGNEDYDGRLGLLTIYWETIVINIAYFIDVSLRYVDYIFQVVTVGACVVVLLFQTITTFF